MTPLLPAFTAARFADIAQARDRVYCADALDLLSALPDDSIDMALTSPPYDNLRTYNGFTWDFEGIARETYRVLKPGGVLVWIVGDATVDGSETLTSMRQALYFVDVCGFKMWDLMIWNKPASPGAYYKRYEQSFEQMHIYSKDEPKAWNPIMERTQTAGKRKKKTRRRLGGTLQCDDYMIVKEWKVKQNVWRIQTDKPDLSIGKHPAPFPEDLARDHILSWSNPGDTVIDFFMGSGTTAKMARANGRHYIGCDISHEYCDIARRRLAQPYDVLLPLFEEVSI